MECNCASCQRAFFCLTQKGSLRFLNRRAVLLRDSSATKNAPGAWRPPTLQPRIQNSQQMQMFLAPSTSHVAPHCSSFAFPMSKKKSNRDYTKKRKTPPPSEAALAKRRLAAEKARESRETQKLLPLSHFQALAKRSQPKMLSPLSGRKVLKDSYGVVIQHGTPKWHHRMQKISQGGAPKPAKILADEKKLAKLRKQLQ